jgi:hypothetical protein
LYQENPPLLAGPMTPLLLTVLLLAFQLSPALRLLSTVWKPGDTVFGYMRIGEGFFNAWFNGFWVEEFDGSGIQTADGSGCRRNCNAKLLKAARSEWWVMIRIKNSTMGWT